MDSILISGGAGFIGTNITNKLIKQGHRVIILDNFLPQVHSGDVETIDGVKYIFGCVSDKECWKEALSYEPKYIIHLASETGTGQSMEELSRYTKTNILGTSVMLECLNTIPNSVERIILSSSRAVYGEDKNIEDSKLNPVSIYALTKLTQEDLLKLSSPIPYIILRYQNVYGPGQSLNNPYTGIISIFSKRFSQNKDIEIWDNGEPTRDFVYIDDVADFTILNLKSEHNNEIFNVGTGQNVKIYDVAVELRDLINKECKIEITDYHRDGDVIHAVGNMEKTFNNFDWRPEYDIKKGIQYFTEYFMNTEGI